MFARMRINTSRAKQFYSAKKSGKSNQIKSAELIHSSRLKLVFDSTHVKCDVYAGPYYISIAQ